jgi:hypothetical protein
MGILITEYVFDDEVYTFQQLEQLKDVTKIPNYKNFNLLKKWAVENTDNGNISTMIVNINRNSITIDFNLKKINEV